MEVRGGRSDEVVAEPSQVLASHICRQSGTATRSVASTWRWLPDDLASQAFLPSRLHTGYKVDIAYMLCCLVVLLMYVVCGIYKVPHVSFCPVTLILVIQS